ncbi:MAG: glucose-6-phosphate isomerase [Colwellia sp.]|nr:glucose-6-phosphate isomerase [Colwellia sp.]
MKPRTSLPSWMKLVKHVIQMKKIDIKTLFREDRQRFNKFSIRLPHMLFDFSKNNISDETMKNLISLAHECEVEKWREKLFSGMAINSTEERAVLHTALRNIGNSAIQVNNENVMTAIDATLTKIEHFSRLVRCGEWQGYSGKAITDIVNIGVGGSNLGPQMVTEALKNHSNKQMNVHYVSNVDSTQISNVLSPLNPATVLFIISSKTFTTTETIINAKIAMNWLKAELVDESAIKQHFVSVTANKQKAIDFGIAEENVFELWNWVGGRFSLWSAVGLPIALALGFDVFKELLEGAYELDQHFCSAALEDNAPIILALISVWNCTFLGRKSQAILPYDQPLHMLTAYLQQAEMESNGKSVTLNGNLVNYPTVPLIWGTLGINGQHAFYQYLHQSSNIVPADFIGSIKSASPLAKHQDTLIANLLAQSQALMMGVSEQEIQEDLKAKGYKEAYINSIAPHKIHRGNRPTNTLLLNSISPRAIGGLIALYEHKIFVQGVILQICSFDQWGVELGKGLATEIQKELAENQYNKDHDASTLGLIKYYQSENIV